LVRFGILRHSLARFGLFWPVLGLASPSPPYIAKSKPGKLPTVLVI
jgi:hypothetical protein